MPNKNTQRRLQAREAAHTSWSRTTDRTARTQPGRDGLQAKIVRDLITKIGQQAWDSASPSQRQEWAAAARSEHFAALVRARHQARWRRQVGADQVARFREFLNEYYANIDDSA